VNEPIEVDDDVSHEASENKEQGLYDWFTFSPDYVRRMKQKLKTS
jgi:hypothetical protein